jgi:hypothetical protein
MNQSVSYLEYLSVCVWESGRVKSKKKTEKHRGTKQLGQEKEWMDRVKETLKT